MGRRDELIARYAQDLEKKCGVKPDMDLLTKVTIGCGPAIYRADSSLVAGSDPKEIETIRRNFLVGRLGLKDGPELEKAIGEAIDAYGKGERQKHRAVVCYLLVKRFGREAAYA